MNRAKKINQKIIFATEFWMKLQRCDVEAFDFIYPVDVTAILEDLKDCINRIISQNWSYKVYKQPAKKYLKIYDLAYLIEEYNQYIKHTPFIETDIEPFLTNIKAQFHINNNFELFLHDTTRKTYSDFMLLINDIDHCLNRVRSNLGYFNEILEMVLRICRNRKGLSQEILKIEAYLTEL